MKTKYFLVFLALLLSPVFNNEMFSQRCLVFRYDNDGNRIKRFVDNNCDEIKFRDEVQEVAVNEDVAVYPNPTDGKIMIVLGDDSMYELANCELYDINGVLIIEQTLFKKETEVDIGNVPVGVYLLKVFAGNDEFTKIIVKQ